MRAAVKLAGITILLLFATGTAAAESETFTFEDTEPQTWDVPDGVAEATFTVKGAGGGASINEGGAGGRIEATLDVSDFDELDMYVAEGGEGADQESAGGWGYENGEDGSGFAGGGGGLSAVVTPSDEPLLRAGGGGGAGGWSFQSGTGGDGGGDIGGSGGGDDMPGGAGTGAPDTAETVVTQGGGAAGGTGGGQGDHGEIIVEWETTSVSFSIHAPDNIILTPFIASNVSLEVTADDSISEWKYSLDGNSNTTFLPNTTLPGVGHGQHHLKVWATNADGETGVQEVIFTVDDTTSKTYQFTNASPQTWNVPDGLEEATFTVAGPGGGGGDYTGGDGGRITGTIDVTNRDTLDLYVAEAGIPGGDGGWGRANGGESMSSSIGAGGGMSAVVDPDTGEDLLKAGGGGGGGAEGMSGNRDPRGADEEVGGDYEHHTAGGDGTGAAMDEVWNVDITPGGGADGGNSESSGDHGQITVEYKAFKNILQKPANITYETGDVSLSVLNPAVFEGSADTWEYSLNGGTKQQFTPNTTLTGLDDGNYQLAVYATDSEGNTVKEEEYFSVDRPRCVEPTGTETFAYTGSVQEWTVPDVADEATFTVDGPGGGGGIDYSGGDGGHITGTINVTSRDTLDLYVAEAGDYGGDGGWGRVTGGDPGNNFGSGGGMSAVVDPDTGEDLLKAGGGGGGGADFFTSPLPPDGADEEVGGTGEAESPGGDGTGAAMNEVWNVDITPGGGAVGGKPENNGSNGHITVEWTGSSPPDNGNWVITDDCVIDSTVTAPENVVVKNDALVTITENGLLGVDFLNFHLLIRNGAGILLEYGGTILHKTGSE